MYLSVAWASGKCTFRAALRNLALVWLSNLAGSVFIAYFLCYLPEIVHSDPQASWMRNVALKKVNTGWGAVFLKGVGCNLLVCLALWCNLTAVDVVSKILALWWPISVFLWIGWEHCVANFFFLPIVLMEGMNGETFGDVLAWNLIPVTLGNILGGLLFAMGQWTIYGGYAAPSLGVMTTKHHR